MTSLTQSNRNTRPIGVFDSGLGGLTVLTELRRQLPKENFVYLGDTARTPYGSKGPKTIARYADECIKFLQTKNVKLIVAACNTVSALGDATLNRDKTVPVIGTIESALKEVAKLPDCKKIAVIGTEATIGSKAYEVAFNRAMPDLQVDSLACPLFVPMVEQGILEGRVFEVVADHYLERLRLIRVDALVLACTHYPLLKSALESYLGSEVVIVEPSKSVAELVTKSLEETGLIGAPSGDPTMEYFVTDEVSRFDYLARLFLQNEEVQALRIEDLA